MPSDLILTLRVHDPDEKKNAAMSACWASIHIDRANIGQPAAKIAEQLIPLLKQIKNMRLT
jgi:hypothetical protein